MQNRPAKQIQHCQNEKAANDHNYNALHAFRFRVNLSEDSDGADHDNGAKRDCYDRL